MNFLYRNLSTRKLVAIGLSVLVFLTMLIGWLIWQTVGDMNQTRLLVRHTRAVQFGLGNFRSALSDAESCQLRYILTHDNINLEPYRKFVASSADEFKQLRSLTSDNQGQQKNLDQIGSLLSQKYSVMEQTIALTQKGDYAGAGQIVKSDAGRVSMEAIETLVGTMQSVEARLLVQRQDYFQRNFKLNIELSVALILICFASILTILLLFRRMEHLQSVVTLGALSEMIDYEGGAITLEEYVRRRREALMTHGHAQIEAERLLGLLGQIRPRVPAPDATAK